MPQLLSRNIPAEVKRQVRQRCGFGCVVCGSMIFTYHHFEPEFAQASVHDPCGIVLLCASCHDKIHRGLLSKETLRKHVDTPKCFIDGFSRVNLDVSEKFPIIKIGKAVFIANTTILNISGKKIFYIAEPENKGWPFRVNFRLFNTENKLECQIINNEWQAFSGNWDIECVGSSFKIWRARHEIALQMHIDLPNSLTIEKMDMNYKGIRVTVSPDGKTTIFQPDGSIYLQMVSPTFVGNDTIIQI